MPDASSLARRGRINRVSELGDPRGIAGCSGRWGWQCSCSIKNHPNYCLSMRTAKDGLPGRCKSRVCCVDVEALRLFKNKVVRISVLVKILSE